jgi:hypothetical protein
MSTSASLPAPGNPPPGLLEGAILRREASNKEMAEARKPLVAQLKGFDKHIDKYQHEEQTNKEEKIALDLKLDKYRWTAGKLLFDLRETFRNENGTVYSRGSDGPEGWTAYLKGLCEREKFLAISVRTAATYIDLFKPFAEDRVLGEMAIDKGMGKQSKTIFETKTELVKVDPAVTDAQICDAAKTTVEQLAKTAHTVLTAIKERYIMGKFDKVQKIERADDGYRVTVRVAASVIPVGHEVTAVLSSEQLREVKGGVIATVTLMNDDAVSKFMAACGISTVSAEEKKNAEKAAKAKGAAEGK